MFSDDLEDQLRDETSDPYKKFMEIIGDKKKIDQIAEYLDNICHHCWICEPSCQCWNDE